MIVATVYERAEDMQGVMHGWDKNINFVVGDPHQKKARACRASTCICADPQPTARSLVFGSLLGFRPSTRCPAETRSSSQTASSSWPSPRTVPLTPSPARRGAGEDGPARPMAAALGANSGPVLSWRRPNNGPVRAILYVSDDGGMSFTRVCLPTGLNDRSYMLRQRYGPHGVKSGVFLLVDHDETDPASAMLPMASAYASSNEGVQGEIFTLSLERVLKYRQEEKGRAGRALALGSSSSPLWPRSAALPTTFTASLGPLVSTWSMSSTRRSARPSPSPRKRLRSTTRRASCLALSGGWRSPRECGMAVPRCLHSAAAAAVE